MFLCSIYVQQHAVLYSMRKIYCVWRTFFCCGRIDPTSQELARPSKRQHTGPPGLEARKVSDWYPYSTTPVNTVRRRGNLEKTTLVFIGPITSIILTLNRVHFTIVFLCYLSVSIVYTTLCKNLERFTFIKIGSCKHGVQSFWACEAERERYCCDRERADRRYEILPRPGSQGAHLYSQQGLRV